MKIGSLFSGYGGLDMAVASVTGGTTAWVSDIDKGACKILTHRFRDVPNHGDITQISWSEVEPVDILTGGFPCQDLSHAGLRAGLKEGTRSGLWSHMARAIDELRPRMVVAENVRGLLSADAPGDVEPCAWCVGEAPTVNLRALGVVLADLADLGYDAQWVGLRAADVGACHGRFRVFLIAHPAGDSWRVGDGDRRPVADAARDGWREGWAESTWVVGRSDAAQCSHADVTLLPSPVAQPSGNSPEVHLRKKPGREVVTDLSIVVENGLLATGGRLLPTPDASADKYRLGGNSQQSKSLAAMAIRGELGLRPTPSVADVQGGRKTRSGERSDELLLNGIAHLQRFGEYAPAIARHEQMFGTLAPSPTEPTGPGGKHQLASRFVEWMMGLPDGWVTGVPDLTRNEALKALGNGVVPQQAVAALRHMLATERAA